LGFQKIARKILLIAGVYFVLGASPTSYGAEESLQLSAYQQSELSALVERNLRQSIYYDQKLLNQRTKI